MLPSLTGKGVAIGTPYYMAPEQMRRETLDGRADQFAWGVVAYELLSGSPAWGATSTRSSSCRSSSRRSRARSARSRRTSRARGRVRDARAVEAAGRALRDDGEARRRAHERDHRERRHVALHGPRSGAAVRADRRARVRADRRARVRADRRAAVRADRRARASPAPRSRAPRSGSAGHRRGDRGRRRAPRKERSGARPRARTWARRASCARSERAGRRLVPRVRLVHVEETPRPSPPTARECTRSATPTR